MATLSVARVTVKVLVSMETTDITQVMQRASYFLGAFAGSG